MILDKLTDKLLNIILRNGFQQQGAHNLRYDGQPLCHGDSENIKIKTKEDGNGVDVYISREAQGEEVHIPVVVTVSGMKDEVYNDFYIEDGAKVTIIAGCAIHNDGCNDSRHDGIHAFHVGKYANVVYQEKHFGEGSGTGKRFLNPKTVIELRDYSIFTLDTAQIEGVDSAVRDTEIRMMQGSKLYVTERLMTHEKQTAVSNVRVYLNGDDSSAQIISRSVAKGESIQTFHPAAIGNAKCNAHIQCDSIIMEQAQVSSIPEINANHIDAAIIHEAAIGRINSEQLIKLRTLGMTEAEAEAVIVEAFLN